MAKRVMITGATGLLGRAVSTKFSEENWDVTRLANSRAVSPIIKLNLLDSKTLNETISQIKPHIIVHCAAERRPDVVENNYEDCCKLNVGATQVITQAAKANDSTVIFISTDYVFNGKNAPYKECDDVDPLNKYGMSKVEGEKAVLEIDPESCVMRVPLLYGQIENLEESGVTVILKELFDKETERLSSDFEIRHPAHTKDVASVIYLLASKKLEAPKAIHGIYQWSGDEPLTRYQMTRIMSDEFNLNMDHIKPRSGPSPGATRPFNVKLDKKRLTDLGAKQDIFFRKGIKQALKSYMDSIIVS